MGLRNARGAQTNASGPRGVGRRAILVGALTAALALTASRARAEDVAVPVSLQAELLAKVAAYDKNLASRAGDKARVTILQKTDSAESARIATQMQKALADIPDIAGLPIETSLVAFTSADDLASSVKTKRTAIVYITPGFEADVGAIAKTLTGANVLTVSAVASYVPKRAVLGFDLISGKPKLVVNITQARLQSVAFKPDVLKLMKVYE